MQSISLNENNLFKCNEIHVQADQAEEKSHPPLCWEEQINSKQVGCIFFTKSTIFFTINFTGAWCYYYLQEI